MLMATFVRCLSELEKLYTDCLYRCYHNGHEQI
jgi:hypothetical protein